MNAHSIVAAAMVYTLALLVLSGGLYAKARDFVQGLSGTDGR